MNRVETWLAVIGFFSVIVISCVGYARDKHGQRLSYWWKLQNPPHRWSQEEQAQAGFVILFVIALCVAIGIGIYRSAT